MASAKDELTQDTKMAENHHLEASTAQMSTAQMSSGRASFSTKFGQFPFRINIKPGPNMIVRSNPALDAQKTAEYYQKLYPKQCRDILFDFRLGDWFAPRDIHIQGGHFLWNVLYIIAARNTQDMDGFNIRWSNENRSRLVELCGPVTLEQVFDDFERDEYGDIFLNVALMRIRHSLYLLSQSQGKIPYSAEDGDMNTPTSHEVQMPAQSLLVEQEPARLRPEAPTPEDRKSKKQEQKEPEPLDQGLNEQEAAHASSTVDLDRLTKTDETRSSSDAEANDNVKYTFTEKKTRRRSSFHGVTALSKDDVIIPKARNVVAAIPTTQSAQHPAPRSSEFIKSPKSFEHGAPPQPSPMGNATEAAGTSPNAIPYGIQRFDNPVYPYALRPMGQARRPSSNLRIQVMEGTEVPRGAPSYNSLNEVVHQQPVVFSQSSPTGQQHIPIAYTTDGQFMFPGQAPPGAFQPSHDTPGFYPYYSPANRPPSRAQPRPMADIPNPAPFRSHNEQFMPPRWQEPGNFTYAEAQPYNTGSLPAGGPNRGLKRDKIPNEWCGPQASRAPLSTPMRYDPGNHQISSITHHYGNQDRDFSRQENVALQDLRRNRSGSIEPFPQFHGHSITQAPPRRPPPDFGEVGLDDFICSPRSIGRLRHDIYSLWVTGFPKNVNEAMLSQIFEQVARVRTVHIKDRQLLGSKRFAFVDFISTHETRKALTAANEGQLMTQLPLEVRVPEQNYNPNHIRYIAPEAMALEYRNSIPNGRSVLPQPDHDWSGRRSSSSSQRGRDFSYRRLSGPTGQRQSFGRQSRPEDQKVRDDHRQYSLQFVRGSNIHQSSHILQSRRSIPEDIIQEGDASAGSNPHKQKQESGSTVTHGTSTPKKKKQKNRKGSEHITSSPKQVLSQKTSNSSSDMKSFQDSRSQEGTTDELNPFVLAEAGAGVIVQEPSTIEEQRRRDSKASPTKRESTSTGNTLGAPAPEADLDPSLESKEKTVIQQTANEFAIQSPPANFSHASPDSAENEDSSVDVPELSTGKAEPSQATRASSTNPSTLTATTTLPAEPEMHDHKAKGENPKLTIATSTKTEPEIIARSVQSKDPSPTEVQKHETITESPIKSSEASQGTPEVQISIKQDEAVEVKSSQKTETRSHEKPAESSASQPSTSHATHKQGPAQTESLSPFSRKKPTKPQPKKGSKKKNKAKNRNKGKEQQLPAPVDIPETPQAGSSGGSRAVSSQSYHTADEADSDRFEDGKSDDTETVRGESVSGSQSATNAGSPAVSLAEYRDDLTLEELSKSSDGAREMTEVESPALPIAEQQDDAASPKFLENKPIEELGHQKVTTSSTVARDEFSIATQNTPHRESDENQQIAQQNTILQPTHSCNDSAEADAVTITAMQPSTSSSMSPSKPRPAPLELTDITNVSPAPAKSYAQEQALNTTSPSVKPGSPGLASPVAGPATTPTGKKRKNAQKKKKRASEASSTGKQESSPASAEYVTPLTSYPPLHQAASTTIVGLRSASTPQSSQHSGNSGKAVSSEGSKLPETPKSTKSQPDQKPADAQDDQVNDQRRFRTGTPTPGERLNPVKGEPKKSLEMERKQSSQGQNPNLDTKKDSSFEMTSKHAEAVGGKPQTLPLSTTAGKKGAALKPEDAEAAEKEKTVEEESGVAGKGREGHKSTAAKAWAISPPVPEISFHDIQAGDAAKKGEEAQAGSIKVQEQKGKVPSKSATKREKSESNSKTAEDSETKEWNKVEKGKTRVKDLGKEEKAETRSKTEEDVAIGEGFKLGSSSGATEKTDEDRNAKEDKNSAAKSHQGEESKPQAGLAPRQPLWTDLFKG